MASDTTTTAPEDAAVPSEKLSIYSDMMLAIRQKQASFPCHIEDTEPLDPSIWLDAYNGLQNVLYDIANTLGTTERENMVTIGALLLHQHYAAGTDHCSKIIRDRWPAYYQALLERNAKA